MLASGCAALGGLTAGAVDVLAREMLWQAEKGSPPRVADLTNLLRAAIGCDGVWSATVTHLLSQHGPALMRAPKAPSHEAVVALLQTAAVYYGGDAVGKEVIGRLREAAAQGLGREGLSEEELRADGDVAAAVARRQRLMRPTSGDGDDAAETAPASSSSLSAGEVRARRRLHDVAWSMAAAAAGEAPPGLTVDGLVEIVAELAHYGVVDPVAQRAVEAAAEVLLSTAAPADAHRLSDAIFAHPQRFRALLGVLRQREGTASGPSALEVAESPAHLAFASVLAGERVDEGALLSMTEGLNLNKLDDVAQAAAVFATQKELPLHLADKLNANATQLSLRGIAAVLWAARKDQTGSVLPAAEIALRRVSGALLEGSSGASLRSVAALVQAASLPRPRRVHITDLWLDAEGAALRTVADHLESLALARDGDAASCTLAELLDLAILAAPVEAFRPFVRLVCARAAGAAPPMTHADTVLSLELCCAAAECDDDAAAWAIVERVSSHFTSLVHGAVGASTSPSTTGPDSVNGGHLLELARLQVRLDAPEMEGAAALLVHRVETAQGAVTDPQLLAAALLLAAHAKRYAALPGLSQRLAAVLTTRAAEGAWVGAGAVAGALEAVTRASLCPQEPAPHTAALADACVPHLQQALMASSGSAGADAADGRVSPSALSLAETVPAFVAAYCRLCTAAAFFDDSATAAAKPTVALDAAIAAAVERRLPSGLSPRAVEELCGALYRGDDALVPASLAHALVDSLPRVADSLSPRQLARCVWGLGQLPDAGQRLSHQLMAEALSDYAVDCAELFWSGPAIAELLYGFSRLHCTKRSLYNVFAARLSRRPLRATMNQTAVGMAMSAFGTAKFLDKELFDRFAASYTRHAPALSPADLLQSVKAHSRVMLLNDNFYGAVAQEAVRRSDDFPLLAKCELLHAYGRLGQTHEAMAATLGQQIAVEAAQLPDANAAVDVLVSLWLMNHDVTQDEGLRPLVETVERQAEQLTDSSLLRLSSLLTDREWRRPALLKALGDQCVSLRDTDSLSPEAARATLDVLARHRYHHSGARREVGQLARSVSKEAPQLSEEEQEELSVLLTR